MLTISVKRMQAVPLSNSLGMQVTRLFPVPDFPAYDPFILFGEHVLRGPQTMIMHPHRTGYEILSYFPEGGHHHHDSLGNDWNVQPGGVLRMTTGGGMSHAGEPFPRDAASHAVMLWVDLPDRLKHMPPEAQNVNPCDIPSAETADAVVRTLAGDGSPVRMHTDVNLFDVSLKAGGTYTATVPEGHRGFLYVLDGDLEAGGERLSKQEARFLDLRESVEVRASGRSRFILVSGRPLLEPRKPGFFF